MSLSEIGEPRYLLLTTFRRDGSGVPTPVWCVREGQTLRVITQASSGKARRILANPNVLVGPCDARGRSRGPQVRARATLQSAMETARTRELVSRRYGVLGWLLTRRGRAEDRVGIEISGEES